MVASEFHGKMRKALMRLGLSHWQVSWLPNSSYPIRGKVIPERLLVEIYDSDEEEAWDTFIHEIVEIKLRSALKPYRVIVNKLIEGYQELADGEKDKFIEGLSDVFEVFRDFPPSS